MEEGESKEVLGEEPDEEDREMENQDKNGETENEEGV